MVRVFAVLIFLAALTKDAPGRSFETGTVVWNGPNPQTRRYELHIIDAATPYAYIAISPKKLNLTVNAKVMFALEGKFLYVVDGAGRTPKTQFVQKLPLPPVPPPVP